MIYLIIGYYLLIATLFVMNSKIDFWYKHRKTIFGLLLIGVGISFGLFFYHINEIMGVIFSGIIALIGIIAIYQKLHNKDEKIEIIHLPKDSYTITSFDETGRYKLNYDGCSYILSSIPPKDTPALKMYVNHIGDNAVATIVRENKEFNFQTVYGTFLYILAVLFPIILYLVKDQPKLFEDVLGAVLGLLIFHGSYQATAYSKDMFGKIAHFGSLGLSIIMWIVILLNIFLRLTGELV